MGRIKNLSFVKTKYYFQKNYLKRRNYREIVRQKNTEMCLKNYKIKYIQFRTFNV